MTAKRPPADAVAADNDWFFDGLSGEARDAEGTWTLKPVGRRLPLGQYLRALWQRRHFIWVDSRARAFSANGGYLLGNAWLVLSPLLEGLTYYLVFGLLLQTSRGIDNYVGYLLVGVFMFHYTSRCMTGGANALFTGRTMIRAFSFPRAALPMSVVLREMAGMGPVVLTMVLMILAIPPHAEVSWRWLLLPMVVALQTVFNLGLALVMARTAHHLPDIRKVVGFVTRLWLYGSAVMFSFERYVEDPGVLRLLEANPLFLVLDITRDLLLYAVTPSAESWLTLTAWAVCSVSVGLLFFWQGEERYGRG